jgi:hypothetical protein
VLSTPQPTVEPIWRSGLQGNWDDYGWSPHDPRGKGPAEMSFANYGGWILAHPVLKAPFGGLRFKFQAPASFGDFLEVRFDSTRSDVFPRVRPQARHRVGESKGWIEVFIPIEELNPQNHPFDRVVIRAFKEVPDVPLRFDDVGLTAPDPARPTAIGRVKVARGPAAEAQLEIDCAAPTHAISPLIYGIAYAPRLDTQDKQQWTLGATARRWGGNPTSRYNWELGNAWNTGADYFFKNVNYTGDPSYSYDRFLEANLLAHLQTALTVPLIGQVAKDTRSFGFPVSTFGAQEQVDPDQNEGGNGVAKDGKPIQPGPPALTSVPAPPDFVERWVRTLREKDKKRGRTVQLYFLDNEPELWNDTHRDVHPLPLSYDELLQRTLAYGRAVRRADPEAVIAGPSPWGWPAYFGSAIDAAGGRLAPDRRAHGNVPLLAWYLRKLREHEQKSGEHILDVVDVHYYPQNKNVGYQEGGKTDEASNALRIRSTRSLWDPSYQDESWIAEKIALIPRLKTWIAENYPGRGISIGEWNFGAEGHLSGGLAVAEALGRFGQQGITAAFYWTYPPGDSPAAYAFRAFRNYDGKGAHFQDVSLETHAPQDVSVFASRSKEGTGVTAVVLNLSPRSAIDASFRLVGCGPLRVKRAFTYDGDPQQGFVERKGASGLKLESVPPYSMSVVELREP